MTVAQLQLAVIFIDDGCMWSSYVWQFHQDDHFQRETKYGERLSINRGIVDITGYSGAWVNNVIIAVRRMATTFMSLHSKAK